MQTDPLTTSSSITELLDNPLFALRLLCDASDTMKNHRAFLSSLPEEESFVIKRCGLLKAHSYIELPADFLPHQYFVSPEYVCKTDEAVYKLGDPKTGFPSMVRKLCQVMNRDYPAATVEQLTVFVMPLGISFRVHLSDGSALWAKFIECDTTNFSKKLTGWQFSYPNLPLLAHFVDDDFLDQLRYQMSLPNSLASGA